MFGVPRKTVSMGSFREPCGQLLPSLIPACLFCLGMLVLFVAPWPMLPWHVDFGDVPGCLGGWSGGIDVVLSGLHHFVMASRPFPVG